MQKVEILLSQEELEALEGIARENLLSLRELFNLFPERILQAGRIPEIDGYKDAYLRTKRKEQHARMNEDWETYKSRKSQSGNTLWETSYRQKAQRMKKRIP